MRSCGQWRPLAAVLGAIGMVVVAAACGVPTSGDFRRINPPAALSETTSTTTTQPPRTGPITSPSTRPPSTQPTSTTSTTSTAPTSSTNPVYDVSLFFVAGPSLLTPVTKQLASPAVQQVVTALTDVEALEGPEYAGLSSALPLGAQLVVTVANGLATVDLSPRLLAEIPASEQTLAVAQIVLTLTSRPGIGQVRFTSDGEPQEVSKADGSLTNPGDDVVCEDYRAWAPAAACG